MNVNIVPPGKSFSGVGRYLLHDAPYEDEAGHRVYPKTSERVAWTTTRNCVNADPEAALREMWRTADEQKFLQKESGHKPHACEKPVKHLDLAWRKGEAVTREEMEDAADDYLLSMGWGGHQAVYICHHDKEHAHLHVVLNKVHPVHGMTMDDFQDKIRSQPWALAYEIQRGDIQSPKRVGKDYTARRKPKDHSIAPGIEREGRKQEQPYLDAAAARDDADLPDRDLLNQRHRDERDAFMATAKEDFRTARRAAYHATRTEFTDAWRQHFDAAKLLRRQARALADWQDHHGYNAPPPPSLKPRLLSAPDTPAFDPIALVERHLKAARTELAKQQAHARHERQEAACKAVYDQRGLQLQAIKERQHEERAELRAMARAQEQGTHVDTTRLRELLTGNSAAPTDPNQLMQQLRRANDNAARADVKPPSNDNPAPAITRPTANNEWIFLEPAYNPLHDRSRPEHALAEGLRALLLPDSPFQLLFQSAQHEARELAEQRRRHREDLNSAARLTRTQSMDEVQMDALEKLQRRAERAEREARLRPALGPQETNRRDDTERER